MTPQTPTPAATPLTALAAVTTVGNIDDARRLAREIVARKLAACAQLSEIESFYEWDGALQNEPEVRIVFKTTEACWPALEQAIAALHPYTLPAIHAVRLDHVHAPYACWLAEQTVPPTGASGDAPAKAPGTVPDEQSSNGPDATAA
jgi:periplasmic divalent cation tolerance protein